MIWFRLGCCILDTSFGRNLDNTSEEKCLFLQSENFRYKFHKFVCMYVCRMSARSDVSSWRSAPTTILYLVFAVSCCTPVVTAAEKAGSNMRTTEKIKSTFKEALRTKRIRGETPTVETPTQNFNEFTKLLTPQEWKSFEEQEQWFRYVTGDNCDQRIYIHSNPESWWKLVKVLNEQFFVNGVFQKTKRNGLELMERSVH